MLGIPDSDVYFAISDAIAAHDTGATLGALEEALESGFDARDLLDGFVDHARNLLLVRSAPDPEKLVGRIEDYTSHEGPSSEVSEDDLVRMVRIGVEAQASAKWSTRPGLIVELSLLRMARLARSVDIEEVVRAVSGGGGSGGGAGGGERQAPDSRRGGGSARKKSVSLDGAGSRSSGSVGRAAQRREREPGGTSGTATSLAEPPDLPAAPADPERWPEVLEMIREQRPSLAASLADAEAWSDGRGHLGLRVPNGTAFHMDQLRDRANMTIMESAARSVFGGRVNVRLDFTSDGPRERPDCAAPSDGEHAADPMVQKVVEMFDGRIAGKTREE